MPAAVEALPRMTATFDELGARASAWFEREGISPEARRLTRSVDMRYAGQNYELPVPLPDEPPGPVLLKALTAAFERAHAQLYGYIAPEEPIQAVTFRLEAVAIVPRAALAEHPPASTAVTTARTGERQIWLPESRELVKCPVYDRDQLGPGHEIAGPAIIEQMDATTLILPGQSATVDRFTNLVIEDDD
jgi:N-methylhydantoinase A